MRASELKPRALSAVLPLSGEAAALEAGELRAILAGHKAAVEAAWEALDGARELCLPVEHGRYAVAVSDYWMYPPVAAAWLAVEALKEDELAYWAEARLRDLEMRLGEGGSPQMVWTLGYSAAA